MEDFLLILNDNINAFMTSLHNIMEIQRTTTVSIEDLELLLLSGYKIKPSDLYLEHEKSRYWVEKNLVGTTTSIVCSTTNVPTSLDLFQKEEKLNEEMSLLLPCENESLAGKIPKWLPSLPPNHTYRRTRTTKHNKNAILTTKNKILLQDPKFLKKELAKEQQIVSFNLSRLSTKIDEHLNKFKEHKKSQGINDVSNTNTPMRTPSFLIGNTPTIVSHGSSAGNNSRHRYRSETKSILYTRYNFDKFKPLPMNMTENNEKLNEVFKQPVKNFDVEKYCHNRLKISWKQVNRYEHRKYILKKNPFIRGISIFHSSAATSSNANARQRRLEFLDRIFKKSHNGVLQYCLTDLDVEKQKKINNFQENELKYKLERKRKILELQKEEKQKKEKKNYLILKSNSDNNSVQSSTNEESFIPLENKFSGSVANDNNGDINYGKQDTVKGNTNNITTGCLSEPKPIKTEVIKNNDNDNNTVSKPIIKIKLNSNSI
ncbi:uncharacterized protein SCODWIG_00975 [Saccharomycodes ludwigii]|uniref:Transcription factor TFIID subunit 8 C-terminal domain-containing protein n=1 Tax=Saccharomycodes ludwigii TaxID=36035 RepID=A0A376B401_9ASCO|nr:uncharacterized protein SCODWIG_00975 [Saccharomycodes ludwigii]